MPIPKNYKELCIDFLYGYSKLANIKTNEELNNKVKNISKDIIKIIPYHDISILTKKELQNYKGSDLKEESIYCTDCSGSSKPIAFLRHLRNAIAHGNLNQHGKFFILEDWDNNNKTNITAIGKFDKTKIKQILELFHRMD